jgi:hypothetical protein
MTTNHPITTPPPELVQQWLGNYFGATCFTGEVSGVEFALATQAAQWGADQELEACIEEVQIMYGEDIGACIRDFRRPKPLSLKKRALEQPHATWGADQELEACCEWFDDYLLAPKSGQLRAARRPKPPSLKEQLLQKLEHIRDVADKYQDTQNAIDDLRETLEALPND